MYIHYLNIYIYIYIFTWGPPQVYQTSVQDMLPCEDWSTSLSLAMDWIWINRKLQIQENSTCWYWLHESTEFWSILGLHGLQNLGLVRARSPPKLLLPKRRWHFWCGTWYRFGTVGSPWYVHGIAIEIMLVSWCPMNVPPETNVLEHCLSCSSIYTYSWDQTISQLNSHTMRGLPHKILRVEIMTKIFIDQRYDRRYRFYHPFGRNFPPPLFKHSLRSGTAEKNW